ncbi:hypothetical protein RBI11_11125 [Acinetobacter baumannii]|uniref:ABC-three component system protein n=1 Tax=Acinetobacter TaxID=469 RepID=UPI001478933E|nr:ABC-three component system protein [Acinetobacter geminorum]
MADYDASSSWSGFNYQGKVAIYYVLKKINEAPLDTNFLNYKLLLEATEDFEIIHNGISISYHQVKAYNSQSFSKYSNALISLLLELYKSTEVKGYIHTWLNINFKSKHTSLIDSIKTDLKKILEDHTNKKKGEVSILEYASSENTKIPKLASIIKQAYPSKTLIELQDILKAILSNDKNCLTRLRAFTYPDGKNFCDLEEINNKIKAEIKLAFDKRKIPSTEEQIEKAFRFFLGKIDEHIIERHKKSSEEEKSISFEEIKIALNFDHEDIGHDYLAYRFKLKFAQQIEEYISDEDDYPLPEDESNCSLLKARNLLLSLPSTDLWSYYQAFSPHCYLDKSNNTDNAFDTDFNSIRNVLIRILHQINFKYKLQDKTRYRFIYRTELPPYQHYLPSAIPLGFRPKNIARKIIENPNMNEILFEIENIIYNGDLTYKISPLELMHTEAPLINPSENRPRRDEVLDIINLLPINIAKDNLP